MRAESPIIEETRSAANTGPGQRGVRCRPDLDVVEIVDFALAAPLEAVVHLEVILSLKAKPHAQGNLAPRAGREPLGSLGTWLSFFPPATPLVVVLRSAATAAVPWWQQSLGILVLLATTLLVVFLAARILRIGFLARGKTPKLIEILRWAVHG